MSQNLKVKRAKNSKNDTPYWLRMVTPVFYVTIMVVSVVSANAGLIKQQEYSYPTEMTIILNDEAAQAELSNYNYLTTYRALSNVLGFMGDTHWVGKAPNDILLGTRMNNEMRIICLQVILPARQKLQRSLEIYLINTG